MEQTINAEVKAVSTKNNSALFVVQEQWGPQEFWAKLAPQVKIQYVKKGTAEIKQEVDEMGKVVVTYCKMLTEAPSIPAFKKSYGNNLGEFKKEFKPASDFNPDRQRIISNQWAINAAIECFKLNRDRYPDQTIDAQAIVTVAKILLEESKKLDVKNENTTEEF